MIRTLYTRWRTVRHMRTEAREALYTEFAASLSSWTNRALLEGAMILPDPREASLCMAEWRGRLITKPEEA